MVKCYDQCICVIDHASHMATSISVQYLTWYSVKCKLVSVSTVMKCSSNVIASVVMNSRIMQLAMR